ncbi:hypothetical protein, conserved [Trypanosoma brucei gambiense DAL972]|uniref:Uncharacterized protein n=2 Tax=Trypanosoma brucei TaxID=5691 RepID=C9ZLR7_TRYB9|nr:hypothetical protein, conserved [Trypanosoma brucei gambiense DAL972]RHW72983.1 hypothetical protein DPX39_040009400 [Trypanosoma brucei equiperdum]CBH10342.1 hypothetical protein, conserved [Trypanosoma brucei gambiense DAL972]|eukprot:XP_011772632.1 hypothetical protein, conserved [Trypanosoma brucei gambiense DAL972]
MIRRQTYVWSIFTGASAAYRWFPPRRECFRFAGAEANSAGGGAGASSGVHQTVAVNAAPEGFWRCLFSSWQQGLVASIGAVTGIGAVGFFLYVSMKDDTVHHTAAVASEALGDARLRERATNLSKEVVESVLKDQKSVELVVGLVVRVLQEDDSMIAVSSFLRSLFEDHYTQEVTKKFVLMTLLDPWIQEQVRLIAKDLVKGLLRDPEVKKALVEFLSDSAATSLHDERLHYNMAHAVRSVAKRAVSPFT